MSVNRTLATLLAALSMAFAGACGNDTDDVSSAGSTTTVPANLGGVVADANRMAPALESALRGTQYPTTLSGAKAALDDAGIETTGDNEVGGYVYDPDAVEFRLCIESPDGAYATYDTKPMAMFVSGESGGCPSS